MTAKPTNIQPREVPLIIPDERLRLFLEALLRLESKYPEKKAG